MYQGSFDTVVELVTTTVVVTADDVELLDVVVIDDVSVVDVVDSVEEADEDVVDVRSQPPVEDTTWDVVSDEVDSTVVVDFSNAALVETADDTGTVEIEESVEAPDIDEDAITLESVEVITKDVEPIVGVVHPAEFVVDGAGKVELLISRA